VCNTGVGLTPRHADRLLHLSAGGLYDGLVLLVDDETRTFWDHVTGEALLGPLAGSRLARFGVEIHTVKSAAKRWPDLRVLISRPGFLGALFGRVFARMLGPGLLGRRLLGRRLPPGFRKTMGPVDPRLPEHTRGLGVIGNEEQVFLPMACLADGLELSFEGHRLHAGLDPDSGVPFAEDAASARPLQLWSRWYGFSLTYPDCRIVDRPDPPRPPSPL